MSRIYTDSERKNYHINNQNRTSIQYILFYIQRGENQYKENTVWKCTRDLDTL